MNTSNIQKLKVSISTQNNVSNAKLNCLTLCWKMTAIYCAKRTRIT
jgi:hypothetical protein